MKDQTREKILSVAARLFGKYGFHKTTMDEIARTAHKAKGSVYYYFKSKEDLFLAVVTQEIDVLKSGLTKVIVENQSDATGLIKNYILQRMHLMKGAINYHESLKEGFNNDFSFLDDCREEFISFEISLMQAVLERGIRERKFQMKDTRATAQVIILAIKSTEIPFYQYKKIAEFEQTIIELIEILVRGLEKS